MSKPQTPREIQVAIEKIVAADPRYATEVYYFVWNALQHGQSAMGLGVDTAVPAEDAAPAETKRGASGKGGGKKRVERHMTGQQLCEAIRDYGWQQFGLLARCVFEVWGVHSTGDFGEIVYNFIRAECMGKSKHDRREDFDDVYDFEDGLVRGFHIEMPKP